MKKKIAILGSTGSIGKTLLKIIKKDKSDFIIQLLSAHKDFKTLFMLKPSSHFLINLKIMSNFSK